MKLVSDFDGVWTLPHDEAEAQGLVLEEALAGWCGERTAAWVREARAAIAATPATYGWAPGGRLSAFSDEDPFAAHSALLHYIHMRQGDDEFAKTLAEAVAAGGHSGLDAFGGWSHAEGVKRVAATRGPGVLADSASAGRRMLEAGVEVVVVSNSGTDKLAQWLGHAGLPVTVHPENKPGAMRLRGSARKFVLDPEREDFLKLGALKIDVARPAYEAILRDEMPDAVVGDVFSLDLALPLALKRREKEFAKMRLFWLVRDYTPRWLSDAITAETRGEVECIEGGLGGVAEALAG